LLVSVFSELPALVHAEPFQRATRTCETLLPSGSNHTTYGVPPTLAISGSLPFLVVSTLRTPPTAAHAEPVQRLTRTW
jgi:hypothetical protein